MKLGFLFRLVLSRHYWKRYALALERQLEGERWRNQAREDEMITVPMRMAGLYGVATREGPAQPRDPLRRQIQRPPVQAANPWELLTEEERAEWPTYLADADPNGTNVPAARREFLQMVQMRRQEEGAEIM
jgi:hypothetical protein